jgi:general stress protein 26
MADYGVPDETDGLLDWSWASERLEASRNYWVVTASADARPHAMPVWGFWIAEQEEFVFSCADNARKARNLRANPRVTVTVDDTVEVVVVEGVATEARTADMAGVVARWAAKYGSDDPDQGPSERELVEFLGDAVAFVVRPERAFGIIERPAEFGPRATRWVW